MQLETVTFWHRPQESGGVAVASSCVGPAPLDVPGSHALAQRLTSYGPATGMNRNTLSFPATPAGMDPAEAVKRVIAGYGQCARCHLCASRMTVVFYRGNPQAAVAFLGEGPGKDEDSLGEPFVGRSGKLQDEMVRQVGLDPLQHFFWMNTVGCRPGARWGDDRAPNDPELIACAERTYLMLAAVRPRVIVCLGKVATRYFFDEPPPVWSFTRLVPQGAPDDWVQVGYAHHPAYLVRCIGSPKMYKEYAAQRTFFTLLAGRMAGLTKVSAWPFLPRYLSKATQPLVAWPEGAQGADEETEVVVEGEA